MSLKPAGLQKNKTLCRDDIQIHEAFLFKENNNKNLLKREGAWLKW
jgi:hypothetical protein